MAADSAVMSILSGEVEQIVEKRSHTRQQHMVFIRKVAAERGVRQDSRLPGGE